MSDAIAALVPPEETAFVAEVAALVPALREQVEESQRIGHLTDEAVNLLDEVGMHKVFVPRSRGGRQVSVPTFGALMGQLARASASTAWVSGIYAGNIYMLAPFSEEANDEVYANEHPKLVQAFQPQGQAAPADGGYRLSGTWRFCTGQHHAQWAIFASTIFDGDKAPEFALFLVPKDEWRVHDDWQVSGLAATGSNSITVEDKFVPAHRVARPTAPELGVAPSSAFADPYYQIPTVPFFQACSVGLPLAITDEALQLFQSRIQKRGIPYTKYTNQAEAVMTHFQMGEASMLYDEAEFHAVRAIKGALEVGAGSVDVVKRVRVRADLAWTIKNCRDAIDIVQRASGASALHLRDPLQLIVRDIQAFATHAFMLYSINAELYGRVLCGLEPDTDMI